MPMPTHVNGKSVKTGSWTVDEDDLLAEWQLKLGNRWSAVSKKIPGRTGQQCAQRWRHKVNPNIRKEKWTDEEDELLISLFGEFGNAWAEISRRMNGRTDQQCMGRWRRHLDPGIKRDAWKPKEDAVLSALYDQHGSQWSNIARVIPGRTAQQCRARWFQIDEEPSSKGSASTRNAGSKSNGLPKGKRRDSYASCDLDDSDYDTDSVVADAQHRRQSGRSRLRAVVEEIDAEISSDEEADERAMSPAIYSPPSRQKRLSRPRARQGPSNTQSPAQLDQLADVAGKQHRWLTEAQQVGRDLPDNWRRLDEISGAEDQEGDEETTPESEAASPRLPSSDLASPPFLVEANLQHLQDSRSPGHRLISPRARPETTEGTPQGLGQQFRRTWASVTPLSGTKRSTPGGGFKIPDSCWDTSPPDNVLKLFQSPHQGTSRSNPLQSPFFQSLVTPDWAKRDWLSPPPSAAKSGGRERGEPSLPTVGKPLHRGPVARKLVIETALRGRAAENGSPMHNVLQHESAPLCSPAKKLRSDCSTPSHPSPSRAQKEQQRLTPAVKSPALVPSDVLVHVRTMTDKENSACNALKQLSMAPLAPAEASGEETGSAQTHLPSAPPPYALSQAPEASGLDEKRASLTPVSARLSLEPLAKGSAHVRLRLHSLLEDL